jgi:hypothetical protein
VNASRLTPCVAVNTCLSSKAEILTCAAFCMARYTSSNQ